MNLFNLQRFTIIIAVIFLAFSCSGPSEKKTEEVSERCGSGSQTTDSALLSLPDVLKDLPKGIEVWHEPDTLRAVKWEKDTTKYIWKHETYLFSDVGDLIIKEFGTYNFRDGEWILGNLNKKLYGPEEMEEWYVKYENGMVKWEHPVYGLIEKNVVYFDPANYSIKNSELVSRKGLWYYIGVDSTGKEYMGYARYVAIPELAK